MAGMIREGGCLCGAVRYRVAGEPVRTSVCSCTFCQRRTGSAFGFGAYFDEGQVALQGRLNTYEHRSDETGRWIRLQFCPGCGVQVTWTVEAMPGLRAVGVGTLDEPKSVRPMRFGWFRSAHPWLTPPEGVEVVQTSALPPPNDRRKT
jgi:hypothetical protein